MIVWFIFRSLVKFLGQIFFFSLFFSPLNAKGSRKSHILAGKFKYLTPKKNQKIEMSGDFLSTYSWLSRPISGGFVVPMGSTKSTEMGPIGPRDV